MAANVDLIGDTKPEDEQQRRVLIFEADPAEVNAKKECLPSDVVVEPEILHDTASHAQSYAGFSPFVAVAEALPVDYGNTLTATVVGNNAPLIGVELTLFLRGAKGLARKLSASTSPRGQARFIYGPAWSPTVMVVIPPGGFWSVVVRGPKDGVTVDLPPLPDSGPLAWWHRELGITDVERDLGSGIKVGVIDSGVGPNDRLAHVKCIGSFINGKFDAGGGADVGTHGTHVCGMIGARPIRNMDFIGIAPGVDLFCARVFPAGQGRANQGDITDAIDSLSKDHQVDLINMSFSTPTSSIIEQDAIKDALERGTLCICAAANYAGKVRFPAAFPESVAVSALGLEGWGPDGSLASTCQPTEREKFGLDYLYLANFSCFGREIACCAPGVGIISTMTDRHGLVTPYGAMDGTSMASPAACAALAVLLSTNSGFQNMSRDESRAEFARSLLMRSCQDVGMHAIFQGRGIPRLPKRVAPAKPKPSRFQVV
jgi:Subtilisin-like serine proteases